MLALLFYILRATEREQRTWAAQRDTAHQKAVTNTDYESIPFVPPFQHSARLLDAIGIQWPAFAAAGLLTSVPQLFYSNRRPISPTWTSYVALAVSVGIYWFAIAVWIDRRLIQRKRQSHSGVVRIILVVTLVPTALFLALFLGKDLLGGWQH